MLVTIQRENIRPSEKEINKAAKMLRSSEELLKVVRENKCQGFLKRIT
jgi:hypothetical protein